MSRTNFIDYPAVAAHNAATSTGVLHQGVLDATTRSRTLLPRVQYRRGSAR
jgi:hypothetical protein